MITMAFIIAATICFTALGIIWNKSDYFNFLLKLVFIGMAFWGAAFIAQAFRLV